MTKVKSILCFSILAVLAFGVNVQASGGDAVAFSNSSATTTQAAVFAAFLANVTNDDDPTLSVDTALSISNPMAAPAGALADFYAGHKDTKGTIEIYLWNTDGTAMVYETAAGSLGPGQTYTVRLAEILSEITGLPEGDAGNEFTGYGWIVGNFDAIAGTYNVTIFGLGFTQNFHLTPAVGQAGYTGIQLAN